MYQSLDVNFNWTEADLTSFLPIILSLLFYVIYWFTSQSQKIKNRFYSTYSFDEASRIHIFFTKYFGLICMGIIPTVISLILLPKFSLADYGLTCIPKTTFFTIVWTLGLCVIVIPLAYFSAKKPKNFVNYPQIRSKVWTKKTIFITALGWALYLFGYEFLFRGILLFPLVAELGVWPAIAINIALYSMAHIPKGIDETIGALPLGFVLCLLTLASGTIWISFLVHLAMALTNCFTALKFHPAIHYQSKK